jgi:tetratricopeptide (TPR) repeat protein
MKKIVLAIAVLFFTITGFSQITTAPSGGNKKASVSERIGLTDVAIQYDRPGVKGREGKIWGELVYTGFTDLGFGNSKAAPWRAGANESTTISFSNAVKIEGKTLPAGKYGFFIAYDPAECTLIFSSNNSSWGSYFYNDKEDVLRVKVKPRALDKSVEWLKYEFTDQAENSAVVQLQWEKLAIPFKVETDYINDQLASFRNELRTERGFMWESWNQAANWCLQRNVNLEQALQWADSASGGSFGGDKEFGAHSTKAQILAKLGRGAEADAVMKNALAFAGMNDMHQYGRVLLQQKRTKEALEVFKTNLQKYPNQSTPLIGMARAYSANGDYKAALKYAQQALPLVTEINSKNNLLGQIEKLKEGKDIN